MKKVFMICMFIFMNGAMAESVISHEGGIHTPTYCSSASEKSCAHLRFETLPTTTEESEFIVHLSPMKNGTSIQEISVKLWMDMGNGSGHESAPVEVMKMDEANHFHVQNAWFVMTGDWKVIVSYKDNGFNQQVTIPLVITK